MRVRRMQDIILLLKNEYILVKWFFLNKDISLVGADTQ